MNKFLSKVHVLSVLMILVTGYLKAQNLNLIPYPSQVEVLKGTCVLNNSRLYTNNKALSGILHFFNEEIGPQQNKSQISKQIIDLKILPSPDVYGSYEWLFMISRGLAGEVLCWTSHAIFSENKQ